MNDICEAVNNLNVDAEHPWLGLNSYTEDTQEYFFGRDVEISEMYSRVSENRLTILFGKSGLGKSSLLGAGLIPKLKIEHYLPSLIRLDFSEGSPSLIDQTRAILCQTLQIEFGSAETSLWEIFHRITICPSNLHEHPPVLIFDQFEEIFTRTGSRKDEVTEWFTQISDLVENRPPVSLQERFRSDRLLVRQFDTSPTAARLVITLREDYLSHLEMWKSLMISMMRNRMALHPLSGTQALEAVVRPGSRGAMQIVTEAVGMQIVRKVARKPEYTPLDEIDAVPPFLSLLCEQLNTARLNSTLPQQQITTELVDAQGDNILDQYYEDSFTGLSSEMHILRSYVEDCLVSESEYRNTPTRKDSEIELKKRGITDPTLAINNLINRRLLMSEERDGIPRLELTHDILVKLAVRSRTARKEKETKILLEKQRKRQRWLIAAITFMVIALVGVSILAYYANTMTKTAEREKLKAQESGKLAENEKQRAQASEQLAKNEKLKAQDSEKMAENEKLKSQTSEKRAEKEKQKAEKSALEAISQRALADKQTKIAKEANVRLIEMRKKLNVILSKDFSKSITDKFKILDSLIPKHADLILLMVNTESMDDNDKQYWFDIMPSMTDEHIDRLYEILETERKKLEELENKYQEETSAGYKKKYTKEYLNDSIALFEKTRNESDRKEILSTASYIYENIDNNNVNEKVNILERLIKYTNKTDNIPLDVLHYRIAFQYEKLDKPQKAYEYNQKSIITLEQSLAGKEIDKKNYEERMSLACLNGSWYALELKNYDKAVELARTGLKITPNDLVLETNLAHALLFSNKVDDAMKIYTRNIGRKTNDKQAWEDVIIEDFRKLRKRGLTHPKMKEIQLKLTEKSGLPEWLRAFD